MLNKLKNNRYVLLILRFLYLDLLSLHKTDLLTGIVTAFVLFLLTKNYFFTMSTSLDDLFTYSIINTVCFILTLYIYVFLISFSGEYKYKAVEGAVFILGFFITFELLLIIILFNGFIWFGVKVSIGKCPWRYLRLFLAILFLAIFWSSLRYSQRFIPRPPPIIIKPKLYFRHPRRIYFLRPFIYKIYRSWWSSKINKIKIIKKKRCYYAIQHKKKCRYYIRYKKFYAKRNVH